MDMIEDAINALKKGKFILIHDSEGREDETDFVINAEFTKPEDIAKMRIHGGGLICLSVGRELSESLELPFIADVYGVASSKFSILKYLKANDIPYDEKSSFSLSINHRKTFTGISDDDRALTISEFGKFCSNLNNYNEKNITKEFGSRFRSPGHVFLLKSSGLDKREGHTELATALHEIGNLTPAAAICEMLDNKTHKSLSREKAIKYAKENNIIFLETNEIIRRYNKNNGKNRDS